MGYLERHDLMQMVALARADKGEGALIGVHGESMGGATVLLAACMEHPPDFVVADCPYADLTEEAEYDLHALFRLPPWPFIPLASLLMRACGGFFFSEVSPLGEIRARGGLPEGPILFARHGGCTYPVFGQRGTLCCKKRKKGAAAGKRCRACPQHRMRTRRIHPDPVCFSR